MLKSLLIKNYALIEHLEMAPSSKLNIITGETGAGKSIMLGAIGLLLGNRADGKSLYNKDEKCIVEATFDVAEYAMQNTFAEVDIDYEHQCIIRREINPAGKSRSFINDTPVTLDQLKRIGARLIDIHSQHETLLLGNSNFQLSILDAYASNSASIIQYKSIYKLHASLKEEYEQMVSEASEHKKQLDYNQFLLNELVEANLVAGEQEKLEADLKLLESSEEIKSRLHLIVQIFSDTNTSVLASAQQIEKNAMQIAQFAPRYKALHERMKGCLAELKDLSYEYDREEASADSGAENIEAIKERLSELYTLEKKNGVNTLEDLLHIKIELEHKVSSVLDLDEKVASFKLKLAELYAQMVKHGEQLSSSRKAILPKVKTELESLLKELGMPNAVISITHQTTAPLPSGMDQISILFSANKGVAPQELKNVASGGEFSRLMLSIKYLLADKTAMPTIIFDEIDTGISGEIAIKVGRMLRQMCQSHQVISISHLPQIAAQGHAHYFVYKDNSKDKTSSKIRLLTEEERVKEIAEMIGGAKPSQTAITNARELLALD